MCKQGPAQDQQDPAMMTESYLLTEAGMQWYAGSRPARTSYLDLRRLTERQLAAVERWRIHLAAPPGVPKDPTAAQLRDLQLAAVERWRIHLAAPPGGP